MHLREQFHQQLPFAAGAVSFDITRAAQWFLADDERLLYPWEEFPCLVPPFPDLWLEFEFPRHLRTPAGLIATPAAFLHSALHLRTVELDPLKAPTAAGHHYDLLDDALAHFFPGHHAPSLAVDDFGESDTVPRWIVAGVTLLAGKRRILPTNLWAMTLDARGRYVRHLAAPLVSNVIAIQQQCSPAAAAAAFAALPAARRLALQESLRDEFEQVYLFALALMHCKNVDTPSCRRRPPPSSSSAPARPSPPSNIARSTSSPCAQPHRGAGAASAEHAGGPPTALHYLRGHFKDYTEHGLFGKHKGIYYWHDHVRGQHTAGIVDKDYRL